MIEDERPATAAEMAIAPGWEEWAIECLDDEQLSHCGHLDTGTIVPGCQYCDEWATHAKHTRGRPDQTCADCSTWVAENRTSTKLLSAFRRSLWGRGASVPTRALHRRVEYRGQAWTLMAVAGTPDEPWDMTATLRTATGKWATARLRELFPADLS